MVGAEARLVDRQRPAHQRLGLGPPVGGPQQPGQVVEPDGDSRVVGVKARLVDRQRPAQQRLGRGPPVGGPQQPGQVVEPDGHVGVVGAAARLVDLQRPAHQRLGLGQPVGVLQQLGQVVEPDGDSRVVRAEARLVDCQRPAHQRLGLGQPVGVLQQLGQVVEPDGHVGVVGAQARLVDRQRPAQRWLGLGVEGFLAKQHTDVVEQAGSGIGNADFIRASRDRPRVRRQGVEDRPVADVKRIADKRLVHPVERFNQRAMGGVVALAAPGDLLHQTVHAENRKVGRTRHQRVRVEFRQGAAGVGCGGIVSGYGDVEQRLGNGFRGQPGEALQQPAGRLLELVERGLPGDRDTGRVFHQVRVVPSEHRFAPALPFAQVLAEAETPVDDVGAGLLEREGEITQFPGQYLRSGGIVGLRPAFPRSPRQQKVCGGIGREQIHRQCLDTGAPVRQPAGDQDVPAQQFCEQRLDGGRCGFRIDVVENQQPAGMLVEPGDDGIALPAFVGLVLRGEIKDRRPAQGGQIALEGCAAVGANKQHRRVAAAAPPGVFERQPCLADAAQPGQRLGDGCLVVALWERSELDDQRGKQGLAPLEQVAEARVREIDRLPDQPGRDQDVEQARAPDLGGELVGRDEANSRVTVDAPQARQMLLLRGGRERVECVTLISLGAALGHGNDQALAVIQGEPGFPLRIGEERSTGLQKRGHRGKPAAEIRIALPDHRYRRRRRHRAGHVAHQVDHHLALTDVVVEHVQRFAAGRDEVFLHLRRDIGALQIMAQGITVAAKLRAHRRQKDPDLRHASPLRSPSSWLPAGLLGPMRHP